MGMKKRTSLKASFWKFLCMLLVGLITSAVIPFIFLYIGVSTNFITYADYSERSTKNLVSVIAATPDLTEVQLPMGCKYLVLSKNYEILETSLEGEELEQAMEYAVSGKPNAAVQKQYLLVTREKEYVVLQYYIGSQFTNEWLNEHVPSPEILLYIFIGANGIAVSVILTTKFSRNLRAQLAPLFDATEQVAQQNLDFEVGHSNIREFEEVLHSFSNMKENLKSSLEKQWSAEQLQREQIAALAHDLKTPLTVIQGNVDLISETKLDEEQQLYAGYITESSEQMGVYIKTLIDISRTVAGYQLQFEKVPMADYMKQMETQINSLCLTKGINLSAEIDTSLGTCNIDKLLLERAVMNVVNNAIDYSPSHGTLYIKASNRGEFLEITITDEGSGFSTEASLHAQEQFFMGNKSRTSRMHFGMGLYITSNIIKQHKGQILLGNSDKTKGAEVLLKIPY